MRYILGISGLGRSQLAMRRHFPGHSERVYRLAQGADSAAALVSEEGVLAAASEERFVRRKGTGEFPEQAIQFVLDQAGISIDQVAGIAHNFDFRPYQHHFEAGGETEIYEEVYSPGATEKQLFDAFARKAWRNDIRLTPIAHHRAHAASAFYCSGFDAADVLVADGVGEFESTSFFRGGPAGLTLGNQVQGLHSLGLVYGLVTMHLGFWMNMDEYKVMGLAPYGDRTKYREIFEEIIVRRTDGGYATPLTYLNRTPEERALYSRSLEYLETILGPKRTPGAALDQRHLDIAAGLQAATEEALVGFLRGSGDENRQPNLCIAGGVGLNCVVNQAIRESGLYKRQFIQPAAGDDGTALGAALELFHSSPTKETPEHAPIKLQSGLPYFGPAFTSDRYREVLEKSELEWQSIDGTEIAATVGELLRDGNVVALFQGRMEFGPRALGNRSILADPRQVEMRDRINSIVKQREEFRPLAPAVLEEYATDCFEIESPADYLWMIETVQVRQAWRKRLGAVTHTDGSARIQVVRQADNELFWNLIAAFHSMTGIPALLNTSFNSRGEPVVCTPEDAVRTFSAIDVDYLVMGQYLVHNKKS